MNSQLFAEAKSLALQGLIPVIQSKEYVLNKDGDYVKHVVGGMRYKDLTEPQVALSRVETYLWQNPNKDGTQSNTLGIKMSDMVNIDFDNMEAYEDFRDQGLIEPYERESTRVNKTPRGVHYLYKVPKDWLGTYVKTTHINGTDVDVLFGSNALEHVFPSYVDHPEKGRLRYEKVNNNKVLEMPDKLRSYLEPFLGRFNAPNQEGTSERASPQELPQGVEGDLIQMLLSVLVRFGYVEPTYLRSRAKGFDFTYDHSVPDPLDKTVIHDHIDNYVIISKEDNCAIVGSYSSKCKPKFLCNLEEPNFDEFISGVRDSGVPTIEYCERHAKKFLDEYDSRKVLVTLTISPMGSGKSYQVIEHFKLHMPDTCLILVPRIMFGQTLLPRLNVEVTDGNYFHLYNEESTKENRFINHKRIVCQMESCWRLGLDNYRQIYVDEIESCLATFTSATMNLKRFECVKKFETVFKAADRIILCDAHIGARTIECLLDMGFRQRQMLIEHNTYLPPTRTAYQLPYNARSQKLPPILALLTAELKKGKRIVFATSSRSFLEKIEVVASGILERSQYECYSAESKNKAELIDVEKAWGSKRLIAYNTTISVGIDFNVPWFDSLFVHAVNFKCGPARDIIQSMHRVRQLRENTMYYSLNTGSDVECPPTDRDTALLYIDNCAAIAKMPTDYRAPTWLRNVHINNIMEIGQSKANYAKVFDYYLQTCGYEKKTIFLPESNLDDVFVKPKELPNYDDIPNVPIHDIGKLKERVFKKISTNSEVMQYQKYLFNELGYGGNHLFHNMFDKQKRDKLVNFSNEMRFTPEQLYEKEGSYADLVSENGLMLKIIKELCTVMGLSHSCDQETKFTAKDLQDKAIELDKHLEKLDVVQQRDARAQTQRKYKEPQGKQDEYVERKNRLSKAMEAWSGNSVGNAKTKAGNSVKKTINGKQYWVYNLEGPNLGAFHEGPDCSPDLSECLFEN